MVGEQGKWVRVVFPHPPYRPLTYSIPPDMEGIVRLGHRVRVPLGKTLRVGFVVAYDPNPDVETRPIEAPLDGEPVLSEEMRELTAWVARYYLVSWGEVIRAALPPLLTREQGFDVHLKGPLPEDLSLTDIQRAVVRFLVSRPKISFSRLRRVFATPSFRCEIARLEAMGIVEKVPAVEKLPAPKTEVWIRLVRDVTPETIDRLRTRAPRQAAVLEHLMATGDRIPRHEFGAPASVFQRLKAAGWIDIEERIGHRDPYAEIPPVPFRPVALTEEQQAALSAIFDPSRKGFAAYLLHGVTGSGKTQVYIEAIRRVLEEGKSALVLIPEISLTPQAVQRYRSAFGNTVVVLHSRLSDGERYEAWRGLFRGEKRIALGPRSAVFAPLQDLGLIVVDEEHEASYKQTDPAPRYHARDVAVYRAKLNRCPIILGSATPSIESYQNALEGKYRLCTLTQRIDGTPLPKVTVVSMAESRTPVVFSDRLIEKMTQAVREGQQIILLQNRRGFAPYLRCVSCGTVSRCPSCDISMTYHRRGERMKCHYCGYETEVPTLCPGCGAPRLICRGIGTQRVEQELHSLFPELRIFRMDLDTTRAKQAHARIVTEFEKKEADLLVGTQMVAKGHDFPGVQLVGVISADSGLHFPDFRSGERAFQLLTQAAGRAGRRQRQGEVVIQTFEPDHPVIRFAAAQDYPGFFAYTIASRRDLEYPPYGRMALVRFSGPDEERTREAAMVFRRHLPSTDPYTALGPAPAPVGKVRNRYRFHLLFKGAKSKDPNGRRLREILCAAMEAFAHRRHRFGVVHVAVDIDPMEML